MSVQASVDRARVAFEAVMRRVSKHGTLLVTVSAGLAACSQDQRTDLTSLEVVDSLYVTPGTLVPFSGPVFRDFSPGSGQVQLEGGLRGGVFDGEFVAYHPNGRIRYMGSFRNGQRCGPWTEHADSTEPKSVFEEVIREVETLALYPACDAEEEGR